MDKKIKIKCDVTSCINNNKDNKECNLFDLSISSLGRGSECDDYSSTICESFEKSGGIITDNEYEISSEFIEDEITDYEEDENKNIILPPKNNVYIEN